jgi:hemerythrin superfamily protein
MNALDLLKRDHRTLEKLFSELRTAAPAQRRALLDELRADVLMHTAAEERFFYPELERVAPDQVKRALQDHTDTVTRLDELQSMDVEGESWGRGRTKLIE